MVASTIAPVALGSSLIAAVFFGAEGVLAKRGIESGGNPLAVSLTVAVVSVVVFGTGAVVFSEMTILTDHSLVHIAVFLIAGVVGSGFGVLVMYQGVDRVGASVNTAVVNSRPLIVAILGVVILSESLDLVTVGGIIILVLGLIFVSLSRGGDVRGWNPIDLLVPFTTAILFAGGNVMRRYGLTRTDIPLIEGIAVNAFGGLVILGGYVLLFRRDAISAASPRSYAWSAGTGCCTASALLSMFFALELERVAIVDAIIATAPLMSLLLTAMFLRDLEHVTRRITFGVILVVIGTILIVSL
ncbi:EamA family transporter [Saliphagus sp. GCM10025334]